jgi:carboxypeptidase Q
MIRFIFISILLSSIGFSQTNDNKKDYKEIAQKIYNYAHKDSLAWDRLAYLCDNYGHRISGSEHLENAINWIEQEMKKDGFNNATKEPVKVPNWKRGEGKATMTSPWTYNIPILALGGSVATPKQGIEAECIIVNDFDDLEKKSTQVKGKIVLYNRAFTNYGETVQYRLHGASKAAKHGAIASLIRSVTPFYDANPHTGVSYYEEGITKIPHAAISLEAVDIIQRLANDNKTVTIKIELTPEMQEDALSHNVMCELKGNSLPEEIVAAGGHIDSWDVGQGAHDDAGPCVAVWEAVKLLKQLNLVPKRTIRVVLWTNEENGLQGGIQYAEKHKDEHHHGLFEFDSGVFNPVAVGYTGNNEHFEQFKKYENVFHIINPKFEIKQGGGGADIGPMMKLGYTGMGLVVDSEQEYWRYHHSANDTVDKVDKKKLNDCIAATAIALYIFADL